HRVDPTKRELLVVVEIALPDSADVFHHRSERSNDTHPRASRSLRSRCISAWYSSTGETPTHTAISCACVDASVDFTRSTFRISPRLAADRTRAPISGWRTSV